MPSKGCTSGRTYERTLEDALLVVEHAKLDHAELRPLAQALYFAQKPEEFKLLELDSDLLTALKEGQNVSFKGSDSDKAVLCTEDKTYEVKEAETSNSLLLIPDLQYPDKLDVDGDHCVEDREIVGIHHCYLEVKRINPGTRSLRSLLQQRPFRGIELEDTSNNDNLYSTEYLLESIQASQNELTAALMELEAFEYKGFWRILDHDYHLRSLGFLLNLIEENSWPLDSIPLGEVLTTLKELLPDEILCQLAQIYLEPTGQLTDDDEELYKLDTTKVARFLGESLLIPVEKFNLIDFQKTWTASVPEGIKTDLSILGGLCLINQDSKPPTISYLPEFSLPEEIQSRLEYLFKLKPKWTLNEIAPYIEKLASGKQTVNALLTKYTRCSTINGVRHYSARHAN